MTKKCFLFFLSFFLLDSTNAQVFWQDDFGGTSPEMGGGTRASSVGDPEDGTCCGLDRFVRTDLLGGGTCCGCADPFSNISNTWAWSGEDLDGTAPCSNATQTITWSGIDITGRTNLEFLGLFGSRNGTSWETTDLLKVEYRIDAGALQEGICFSPTNDGNLDLGLDVDCDITVDGPTITLALAEYTFSIAGTGTSLELIFTATVDAPGEEFAVDNFRLNEGSALPVELITFEGFVNNGNIKLNWTTASEINNEGFEVEHSIDGRNWNKLGFVHGNEHSIQMNKYYYVHEDPKRLIHYYRLKQVNFDGHFEYSNVLSINFKEKSKRVGELYPNPSKTGLINLDYYASNNEQIIVSAFDLTGKLISTQVQQVGEGNNHLSFDFSNFNTGIYILKIGDKMGSTYRKLIIK